MQWKQGMCAVCLLPLDGLGGAMGPSVGWADGRAALVRAAWGCGWVGGGQRGGLGVWGVCGCVKGEG